MPKAQEPKPQGLTRMLPIAIDYGRFSGASQEEGDSASRQQSLADQWSQRTGIPIDQRLFDENVSGYKNQKRRLAEDDIYDLAKFLRMIESTAVQPGDYLLLENFDRLSRDKEVRATHLLTSILDKGIKVVQLAPYEIELDENSDMFAVFRAIMELSRGHGESKRKSQICGASFASNRAAAILGSESYQGALPSWIERDGKGKGARHRTIRLIPERAAIVRRIFLLAAQGWGYTRIARKLTSEGIPPFGARQPRIDAKTGEQAVTRKGRLRWKMIGEHLGAGRWTREFIVAMLRSRAAMGELMTRTGEIIPIPAAVSEEEWLAAQAGKAERQKHRGRNRTAGPENLWQGLLRDAENQDPSVCDSFYEITRQGRGRQWRVLINASGKNCEAEARSFPASAFEEAILRCLKEIDPGDIISQDNPDRITLLSGEIENLRRKIAKQTAEIEISDEPAPKSVLQMLSRWERQIDTLEEERRKAQQEAAHPLSEEWGRAATLFDLIQTAEQRLRLRSILRRLIEEIRLLIVPRGWDRIAAVQMRFRESDEVRSYLIVYRKDVMPSGIKASRRKRERGKDVCSVRSLRHRSGLDLRNHQHVRALREELVSLDLSRD